MPYQLTPSQDCIDLIKQFEGCVLTSYVDIAGVWTIGYGTTLYPVGIPVGPNETCTEAEAESYLAHDVRMFSSAVSDSLAVPINQKMFDACVSLCYNIGISAFKRSTLLRQINEGNHLEASDQFLRWNKVGQQEVRGLTRRRKAEKAMFDEGIDEALAFARSHT
jgi:lysozyme